MYRRIATASLLFLALGAAATGCKSAAEPIEECDDPVVISVTTGTHPRFTWSPACYAFMLVVSDTVAVNQWGVLSDSANALNSGITYGVVPPEASGQTQAPIALVAGRRYAVGVYKFIGPAPDSGEVIGARFFTP